MIKVLNALLLLVASSTTTEAFSIPATTKTSSTKTSNSALFVKRDLLRMPTETPMVPYKPPGSDYAQFIDINSRMYRDRIMMINRYIDETAANEIISIMLYLRKEDSTGPVTFYFNVPGAQLRPALAVYDLICQFSKSCEITTVNLGLCTGMGALLCGAGTKGRRCAMPNSRFLLQRTGMDEVFQGQATDIALEVKNMVTMNDKMEQELVEMTGQSHEQIVSDMKRDFYLSSDEAVRYGLIDKVLLPARKKRATMGKEFAELGAFEGEDVQKYQNDDGQKSGFGGGWKDEGARDRNKDDDDYEPPAVKQ